MEGKRSRLSAVAARNFAADREHFTGLTLAERFGRIHATKLWGAPISVSGLGSESGATARLRDELPRLFASLGISSLLDAPCGDANWISGMLGAFSYTGIDIVPDLVTDLARAHPQHRFLVGDITQDHLPRADAILCRDCLVHLPVSLCKAAIANFRRSGATWLIATTFPLTERNEDCEAGDWRPLNMTRAPFDFPPPAHLLVEGCNENDGLWRDKALGVWHLDAICEADSDAGRA